MDKRKYGSYKLVDFFDDIFYKTLFLNNGLKRLKLDSFLRFIIRIASNVILPCYYIFTSRKDGVALNFNTNNNPRLIVTLTSFPDRILRAWLVIESILRQSHKPDKIVLWLSKDQFNSIDVLPRRLKNQCIRGLEIRFVENDMRSHKKYYYALKEYPEDVLITIDDDIFYRTDLIEELYNISLKYPNTIITQYGFEMVFANSKLQQYSVWKRKTNCQKPSANIFFGTGGGTLLPPHCLSPIVTESSLFMKLAPHADDIWLNAMSRLKKTKVMTSRPTILLPVQHWKGSKLFQINSHYNDVQIQNLRLYFQNNYNVDPFKVDNN